MRLQRHFVSTIMLSLIFASGFAFARGESSDEKTIRDLDAAWSQAAQAKDLDKAVSYYADDASMLPDNAPIATGKAQIREAWSHLLAMPGVSLSFSPAKVVVSKSRDLAYEIGTYQLMVNDAQGNPTKSVGKYVVNWEKRAGEWKVVADIFNGDK